jgi:hypothetical protein
VNREPVLEMATKSLKKRKKEKVASGYSKAILSAFFAPSVPFCGCFVSEK